MNARAARRARLDEEVGMVYATTREESRREIEASYADLPPLPPELSAPDFFRYKTDEASRAFYDSCAQGNVDHVRHFARYSKPSPIDLQYALERASHGFQPGVVRCLMGEHNAQLHVGCFHRDKWDSVRKAPLNDRPSSPSPNVIFESDSPALLELLRAFIDHGWHPNQVLGEMQRIEIGHLLGLQEVALHFPRCLRETPILRLLLDAGADPTIARYKRSTEGFHFDISDAPVQRKSGDILHMAAKVGTRETVDLLLSHGAKLEYGAALHSLVKRASQDLRLAESFEKPVDSPAELAARCDMADYLLSLGEDINGLKNVFFFTHTWCAVHLPEYYEATPLSHALGSRDWQFAEWLLERGADPDVGDRRELIWDDRAYGFYDGHNNEARVQAFIKEVREKKVGEA